MSPIRTRQDAMVFVAMVSLSAISISCILSVIAFEIIPPENHLMNLVGTLVVSSLVAVPIALLLAQSNLRLGLYQARLETLANTDPLTGLHNRRRFTELLDRQLTRDTVFALAFVDLDRFKAVNDCHGHGVGDEVFQLLAHRLQDTLPQSEVARLGGDEFGVILPDLGTEDDAAEAFLALHGAICEPVFTSAGPVYVGASIGIACRFGAAASASAMLRAADSAMMRAKAEGGGVRLYDPALDSDDIDAAEFEDALRVAIHSDRIVPAFQPFQEIATGRRGGFEVLARWSGDIPRDAASPGAFVPLAERLGLIDRLFWRMMEQALEAWRDGPEDQVLAFNISPAQLHNPAFCHRLFGIIERYGIAAHRVEVELTEKALFRDLSGAADKLKTLADCGIGVVLDDFGTGQSSLSLVHELPLTKLKIDQSFVNSLSWSDHAAKVFAATVSLSRALGLKTCAEGVESAPVLQRVESLGCEFAQGYLIGHPQPAPFSDVNDEGAAAARIAG